MTHSKILSTLIVCGLSITAMATTPVRRTLTYTAPNGTQQHVNMWANGRYAVYTLEDGTPVVRCADGQFRPATIQSGRIVPSPISSSTAAEIATTLAEAYPPTPLLPERTTRLTTLTNNGLGTYGVSAGGVVPSIGSPRIPVVMVEYADLSFQETTTTEKVNRFLNEKGYADETGSRGSVRDYFTEQSNGMFTPQFDIVARVKVSKGYAHYGADGTDGEIDPNVQQLAIEAVSKLYEQGSSLSAYADNGTVPLVAIMYAGPGEQALSSSDAADHLWGALHRKPFQTDDKALTVGSFIVFDEVIRHQAMQNGEVVTVEDFDGVGLFCHEFSHALGLPDFYYTGNDAAISDTLKTMDWWSIMDAGEFFYNGYAPIGYNAFERSALGWLNVKELTQPQAVSLYAFGQEDRGATAYVVRNEECPTEFYLLENRQPATWFYKGCGRGMLVTHVDYDENVWKKNIVNNDPAHQRFTYVPADNVKDGTNTQTATLAQRLAGYKGDLFPGTSGVTSLTDDTTPAATLFNGTKKYLSRPLYHIAMGEDSVVTFSFMKENIDAVHSATTDNVDAPTAYFTLSGQRLSTLNGAQPGIYLKRKGKHTEKVIVK